MVHMTSAGPYLGNAMHQEFAADLEAGLKSRRFRFASMTAALDVVKGSTLFGMRSMARGLDEPELAEGITALVLRSLGLKASESLAISRRRASQPPGGVAQSQSERSGRSKTQRGRAESSDQRRA